MNEIAIKFENNDRGAFVIEDENKERIAEMAFGRNGSDLIIYHTEVSDRLKGQGVATQLLEKMVNFAREENLQVVPLCAYVHAQFKRHPERYEDIWNKHWHGAS
jgi:predicted GNAT family acetyltransferase